MSERKQEATACCCGEKSERPICSCIKRICLPILGLVGVALAASMVVRRRKRHQP